MISGPFSLFILVSKYVAIVSVAFTSAHQVFYVKTKPYRKEVTKLEEVVFQKEV